VLPAPEGGPNWSRSIIPSSRAHRIASSTLTARCRSAIPIESNVLLISYARAVAARRTCIKYSRSPLDSPSLGFTWLVGSGSEATSKNLSVNDRGGCLGGGRRNHFGFMGSRGTQRARLPIRQTRCTPGLAVGCGQIGILVTVFGAGRFGSPPKTPLVSVGTLRRGWRRKVRIRLGCGKPATPARHGPAAKRSLQVCANAVAVTTLGLTGKD
jgi:hypothetical protein